MVSLSPIFKILKFSSTTGKHKNPCQVVILCHEANIVEDLVEHCIGDDRALLGGAKHLVHVLLGVDLDAAVLFAIPETHATFSHGFHLVYR